MSANKPLLNNTRCRALAEVIIDLIDGLGMFESIKVYVNKTCLISPEQGTSKTVQRKTKGHKTRYAVEESVDYAKRLMRQPSATVPHVVVVTFDGPLYDACRDPAFRRRFATMLEGILVCYDCHMDFVGKSQISVYPNDPWDAIPFAARPAD